jgi:acetyl-CoA carboxylase carboxyltransferase component
VKLKKILQGEAYVKAKVDLKHKDRHINGKWPSSTLWYIEFKNIINLIFNYMKFFEFVTYFKTTC